MSPKLSKAVVFLNPASGTDPSRNLEPRIESAFERLKQPCNIVYITPGYPIEPLVRIALADHPSRIVAAGGDGTLRAVASVLAGTRVPMAILPAGTLNHFARDLELPFDLDQAIEVAATGTPVAVDVAEANGRIFLNNSVLGLYPFYRLIREREEESGVRGRRAILSAITHTIRRYPKLTVRITNRTIVQSWQTPFLMIANNEHAMEGLKPWQRDTLTEGRLWIYILRDSTRLGLLTTLVKMLRGRGLREDAFETIRAREVMIETRGRHAKVSLDGEILQLDSPLHYRSLPGQLTVLVPPGSRRALEAGVTESHSVPPTSRP